MTRTISKYRDALMGVAILWVMFHHSGINLPNPLFALKRSGYGGVDIFMFLSGLGCAVSLSRNRNTLQFLKRRFIRIYPHYIPILIVFILLNASKGMGGLEYFRTILGNITGLSFWAMVGTRFNWYILAIFTFYMATPLFFEILQTRKKSSLFMLIALSFVAILCFNGTDASIAVSRFPIFILGVEAGIILVNDSSSDESDSKSKILKLLIYCCGMTGLIMLALLY